jgi:ADP-ribosylglycohydrolase
MLSPRGTRDQFQGCLLGGAVGDALGSPVEFDRRDAILREYGPGGIRDFDGEYGRCGAITDDTQMTLFTAEGILRHREGGNRMEAMRQAYDRWLVTQGNRPPYQPDLSGWLFEVKALHSRRAPGNTCLTALMSKPEGELFVVKNDSKGCGGVMRVAPIGLVAEDPYDYAAQAAALTHGHPLGYQASGAMALLISHTLTAPSLLEAARRTLADLPEDGRPMASWIQRAIDYARCDRPAETCIEELGEGWVAEESLAIALFCALRADDLEQAVILAVNHDGDSDSTGSIAGQICGAHYGITAIPDRWLSKVELQDVIQRIADDLYDYSR